MNAIVSLKQVQVRDMLDSAWPEILEQQAALETPAWVEEWLNTGHIETVQQSAESPMETWAEIAEHQQRLVTPAWQTQWLDWVDNIAAAKPVLEAIAAHTVCPFNTARSTSAAPRNGLPWLLSHPPVGQLEKAA